MRCTLKPLLHCSKFHYKISAFKNYTDRIKKNSPKFKYQSSAVIGSKIEQYVVSNFAQNSREIALKNLFLSFYTLPKNCQLHKAGSLSCGKYNTVNVSSGS